MKQIFRNLKNDKKNKENNDTQDLRRNPMRGKTTGDDEHNQSLCEQEEYKTITITTGDLI